MDRSEVIIKKIVVKNLKRKDIKNFQRKGFIVFRHRKKRNRKTKVFSLYPDKKEKEAKRKNPIGNTHWVYTILRIVYPSVFPKRGMFSEKNSNTHFAGAKCDVNAAHSHRDFSSLETVKKSKLSKTNNLYKWKQTSITKEKNIPSVQENILKNLFKIGMPFTKHNIGSKQYQQALNHVKKNFKKYRNEILDIFNLAKEYFNNSDFVYHPKKISINSFFEYSPEELQNMPHLGKYNVKSWFKEFSKGRDYIEENFMKVKTDKNPELTQVMIQYWKQFKQIDKISAYENRAFVIFTAKMYNYAKMKQLSVRTIFETINNSMFKSENPFSLNNPMFFNGEYFWTMVLPKILYTSNILKRKGK